MALFSQSYTPSTTSGRRSRAALAARVILRVQLLAIASSCGPFGGPELSSKIGGKAAPILWRVDGHGGGRPAYDGATAYFLAATDEVSAVDAATGVVRWHTPMGAALGTTPVFGSAVCTVSGPLVACGDTDVVAFRRADGGVAWRFHPTVGYSPGYYEITSVDSTIFTGSPSGTLYAINANNGLGRWATSIGVSGVSTSIFSPVADPSLVVAAYKRFSRPATGGVVAIDAGSGQIRWQTAFPQISADSGTGGIDAVLWGSLVLASCDNGRIYAFDRTTGQILWNLPGVGRAPPSYAIPNGPITEDTRELAVVGDRLFASSVADWVVAYDLVTRTELWRSSSTLGSANTMPIVADSDWVYVVLAGGQIVAFSVLDGKPAWNFTNDATHMYGTVTPATNRVFVSGQQGFYALGK